MDQPKQFDNINTRVVDDLKQQLEYGGQLQIAAASFSIYAFEALREELEGIDALQFIFTSPTFTKETNEKQKREFFIPKLNRERVLYGSDFEIQLRNKLTQKAIARECADWIRRKAKFKTNTSSMNMQGFMNLQNSDNHSTYMPFNEFTTTELGCEKGNNLCQVVMRMPSPYADMYINNFDELWKDQEKLKDVTEIILSNIENVYKENAPEFIYFVTLYNIFKEFLEDISEDVLPNEATGFKSSIIWNKLYNFQKDAALAIINKLEKYNGCILADSVGLGKTFTALSVIKYYENRNKSVLVLCPKKLNDNWITYRSNYKNNPIAGDRLRYDILFHTDLSRTSGSTNGLDLNFINWGNYDLVVIDESHNFRNGGKIEDTEEGNRRVNRYTRLMNQVIRAGVKTKVLMLSATPVNNRFNDLRNQLQLAYEGNDEQFNQLLDTNMGVDEIFREAQKQYNLWAKLDAEERTTQALLSSLSFDFFELLDAVTIARSRKHIQQYYDTTAIGQFPKRLKPISRCSQLTDLEEAITFNEIYDYIDKLNLSIYVPSEFILPSKLDKYMQGEGKHTGLTQMGREKGVRRLMGINLLKRLESSINSFRLTLERIKEFIGETIDNIDNHMSQITVVAEDEGDGWDMEDAESNYFFGKKKVQIALEDMDYVEWRRYLEADYQVLFDLLRNIKEITASHDAKLIQLFNEIKDKVEKPINEGNKKVIIFSAFSDTAQYLFDNLSPRLKSELGLDSALITGNVEARSTIKMRQKLDFNTVLTLFSPVSKEKEAIYPNVNEEIDVLFATDCISEGQNLQDCDYLVNYDIHWNPVRIIQRFGRVDRIGSKNSVIQLVNYWPDMDLDTYINLKARVEARMKISVLTATADDNVLSPEEKVENDYRKEQLKRIQEEVVDLEDMDTGISIMDLGLNEFRLDLLSYMKEGHNMEANPNGLHCVLASSSTMPPGVIYIMKNRSGDVNIDKKNRLHPFYLIYMTDNGDTFVNHLDPKHLLDLMRQSCVGKSTPDMELCRMFNEETHDGLEMGKYSDLLQNAISSIVNVKGECDIMALFDGLDEDIFSSAPSGLDDFELICFFVIK